MMVIPCKKSAEMALGPMDACRVCFGRSKGSACGCLALLGANEQARYSLQRKTSPANGVGVVVEIDSVSHSCQPEWSAYYVLVTGTKRVKA
jgi:hypothetical protein